ncbi:MAG: translation initiation factor IF-3 [bacterium]|nr:translation initiation factor IF-3 [bacterium]
MNTYIRAKEVRVIGPDGVQLGILPLQEALNKAREVGLDLVEVSSQAVPPVCRIMDYGKYKFEKAKREKEARKKQKTIKVKEIKMGPNISEHDYQFKLRHAREFITEGDKVRVAIVYHGRQITHQEIGQKVMTRFIEDIKDLAIPEQTPRMEGKELTAIFTINPLIKKQLKKTESPVSSSTDARKKVAVDTPAPVGNNPVPSVVEPLKPLIPESNSNQAVDPAISTHQETNLNSVQ